SEEPGMGVLCLGKVGEGFEPAVGWYRDPNRIWPTNPPLPPPLLEQGRRPAGAGDRRRMDRVMRYLGDDLPDWDAEDRDFAAVWRSQRKWVVSHSLKSVGPNVTVIEDDFEAAIRRLKAQLDGEIDVAGPSLAGSLTNLGLIDEYRLYLHPI